MPIVFFLMIGLYLTGNFYIYARGAQALATYPTGVKVLLSLLFWSASLSIFITFLFRKSELPLKLLAFMYEIGTGWLVFTLYMVLFLISFDLVRIFYKPLLFGFHISFALTLCLLGYGYYNFKHPKTKTIDITINKKAEVPSLKVVAISDIHLGFGTDKAALSNYVKLINAQNPDLVLIGGDLIDNSVEPLRTEKMNEELDLLEAPLGVYMALGNHEYISGIKESIDFIKSTSIRILSDSLITLPNDIQLIGRDDRHNHHRQSLDLIVQKADTSKPIILIDHQPYNLEETVKSGVDLQFSGHTHQGQVWPMSLLTKYLFDISYGYDKRGNTHFYVSSGLSLWGPPFRIGTNSELVVFNIQFKEEV